jgi:hypothetical protein
MKSEITALSDSRSSLEVGAGWVRATIKFHKI